MLLDSDVWSIENILFFGDLADYGDFLSCRDRCLVPTNMHAQKKLLDGNSWFEKTTQLILLLYPTNTRRLFHVKTTWKKLFPRRFNVEYTSCVWRKLDGQLFSERAIGRFFRKNLFLNFSNIVKDNLDARDACWTKLFRLKYRILHRIDVHLTNLQFCNVFRALSIVQII